MKDLDLTTLRLFVEVCDAQSIKRVAERERVDPSAITKRLAKLENQLQIPLLKRIRQGVQATVEGALFSEQARHLIQHAQLIALQVSQQQAGFSGMLSIASNRSNAASSLVDDLALFLSQVEQKDVQISVTEMMSKDIVQSVRDGKSTLGIIWENTETIGLQSVPYKEDQIAVITPHKHPLATRVSVSLEEVMPYDMVGAKYTRHSEALLRRTGAMGVAKLRIKVEMETYESALRMVSHGVGVMVCPAKVARLYAQQWGLSIVPLSNPWARQITKIIYKNNLLSPVAKHLVDHLIHQANLENPLP